MRVIIHHSFGSLVAVNILRVAGMFTRAFNYKYIGSLSRLGSKLFNEKNVIVTLGDNSCVEIDLLDYYWSRLIFDDYEYEPEVAMLFEHYINEDFALIDCGANIGYWSVLASAKDNNVKTISVEASSNTYTHLIRNRVLNNKRFKCINAAIYDQSGLDVKLNTCIEHAAAHVITGNGSNGSEIVTTISIDDIVKKHLNDFYGLIVVKLDVEGVEIQGVQGAVNTLNNKKVVFIYEDHGNDASHSITKYMINELGLSVFTLGDSVEKINDIDELNLIKKNLRKGYNFLAVSHDLSASIFV